MIQRIRSLLTLKNRIRNNLRNQLSCEPTNSQVDWCFYDYLMFKIKYKGDLETDYFGAQVFKKSDFIRKDSFANKSRFKWRNSITDPKYIDLFDNKLWFYDNFKKYLGRNYINSNEVTYDEFCDFIKKCSGKIFVKYSYGYGGKDVRCFNIKSSSEIDKLYSELKGKDFCIEEELVQSDDIRQFSLNSVNTFRIVTIIGSSGKVHIAAAILRIGVGDAQVDNFSSGGICAHIDCETGIIKTSGRTKDGKEFLISPDTGKQIIGYRIPDWENYKDFAKLLASQFTTVRYVGWDIIKDENGKFCVIEGNREAGVGMVESMMLGGVKGFYNRFLND